MSEQAFDLQEAIYGVADTASDPAAAATALRALLGRLEGQQPGGHQAPGVGPGGSSVVAPEATPLPVDAPFPLDQLGERVDQVGKQVQGMGEQERQDTLHGFVNTLNRSLDEAARQQAPHRHPRPPATNDAELADLAGRINQAAIDPAGSEADVHSLADEFNRTLDSVNAGHLQRVDDWERRRSQAEQARQAKAHAEVGVAKTLRQAADQLNPAGR